MGERLKSSPLDYLDKLTPLKKKSTVKHVSKNTSNNVYINTKDSPKSAKQGLPKGWIRATFIVREEHLEKMKTLAFLNKTSLKNLTEQAFQSFLKNKSVKVLR